MTEATPSMSVVLAVAGGAPSIRRALDHLGAQSRSGELELVIVTDAADPEALLDARTRARFGSHQIVRLPAIRSKAEANAEGARRARAPVVAFAEDHCFAASGWAEALIGRHESGCDAVAPRIANANPATTLSWCDLLVNYGPWLEARSGPRETLPGHNCSYRKEALAGYQGRLAAWLDVENQLHLDMRGRGLALWLEADAVVAHVNISRWRSWLPALFHAGRIYAAERRRSWAAPRRLLYAAGWPAIAALRWLRMLAAWPAGVPGLPTRRRLAPTLGVGLLLDAAGQGLGYLAGAGGAGTRMLRYEFGRGAHVRAEERPLLEGGK